MFGKKAFLVLFWRGVVNALFGGGFFLEGFVGFLVTFSKGDGRMVGGDGGR